jgi:simple sugar transport system permease protein
VQIPSAFLSMLPFVATLFAVAGLVGKVSAPAADGVPYTKE